MLKKEIFIFLLFFCALALGMHMNEWISHPLEHFKHLATHKMPYHPLLYTSLLYIFTLLLRLAFYALKKAFKRS